MRTRGCTCRVCLVLLPRCFTARVARGREVAGGGREVRVAPERLQRWLAGVAEQHGALRQDVVADGTAVRVIAADGTTVTATVPHPPLPVGDDPWRVLVAHAAAPRTVGLLLVRLGGYGVGIAEGEALSESKIGARPVHGRAAAGGWSQHRFARRREGQARVALGAAAEAAVGLLAPACDRLAAVITGGDRVALADVLSDRRLARLLPLVSDDVLDVPDPRRRVLEAAALTAREVRVVVRDQPSSAAVSEFP